MNALLKHRAEFRRALETLNFEKTDAGIYFPKQRSLLNGVFEAIVPGMPSVLGPNTVTTQALIDFLKVYFAGATALTGAYIAPFSGNVTPQATWTAANFAANSTEFTGYDEGLRQQWVPDAITTAVAQNAAAPATFTITSGPATVRGAGLITNISAKGDTTGTGGKLVAAARFAADITGLPTAAELGIKYTITAADGG